MEIEDKELEKDETEKEDEQLADEVTAAGNALLSPPYSVQQLLPLLDTLENLLLELKQSPSNSVQKALNPAIKALATNELLNHLHVDVKVSVAVCISEIFRITAPDAPYGDEQMKEIFKLIVQALDNFSDISSHLYQKRASLLHTFARLRLWVLMLDLQCHSLILEMFNNFLRNIRENHPDIVFMYMGFIMIMVLEESEEIRPELLFSLLGCVRKGNQNVLPVARKLGERIIENCASKLAPYMHQAVQYAGFPLDDYSKIVAYIWERKSETLQHDEFLASHDNSTGKHLEMDSLSSVDQSSKLGNICSQHNKDGDNLSAIKWTGKRVRGKGKINCKKNLNRQFSAKRMIPSAKSNKQSSVNESNAMVETLTEKSMRKGSPRGKKTCLAPDDNKHFCEDLIGSRIKVRCSNEQMFYQADVVSYDPIEKKHKVRYADGKEKTLHLIKERWEFVGDVSAAYRSKLADLQILDTFCELQKKKRQKINSDSLTNETMREGTSIRKLNVKVPKSCSENHKNVENNLKSESKTPLDIGNTNRNGAVESKDESDQSCSISKESAVDAALKLKDDLLKPTTVENNDTTIDNNDTPRTAMEEGEGKNEGTNILLMELPLKYLVARKLKKLTTARRENHQIMQSQ